VSDAIERAISPVPGFGQSVRSEADVGSGSHQFVDGGRIGHVVDVVDNLGSFVANPTEVCEVTRSFHGSYAITADEVSSFHNKRPNQSKDRPGRSPGLKGHQPVGRRRLARVLVAGSTLHRQITSHTRSLPVATNRHRFESSGAEWDLPGMNG